MCIRDRKKRTITKSRVKKSLLAATTFLCLTTPSVSYTHLMVTQKNNFHEFETYNIFLWIFKAYVAIYLVTNTFNITMAVFDVGQHVVNNAAGVISGNTAVDATEAKMCIRDRRKGGESRWHYFI